MAGRHYPCCCPDLNVSGLGSPIPGTSSTFGDRGSSAVVACSCCQGGVAPLQVQVVVPDGTVSSVIYDHPLTGPYTLCDECDEYNADYLLNWTDDPADGLTYCMFPGSVCWWKLDFPAICERTRAHVAMSCGAASVKIQFALMPTACNGGGQWLRWERTVATSPLNFGCFFDGLEIPRATVGANDCWVNGPVYLYAA